MKGKNKMNLKEMLKTVETEMVRLVIDDEDLFNGSIEKALEMFGRSNDLTVNRIVRGDVTVAFVAC